MMFTESSRPLRRRLIWSVCATLFLVFVSSTSTLSTEHRPKRAFSLGLERALAPALTLEFAPTPGNPTVGTSALRSAGLSAFSVEAPRSWRLRPREVSGARDGYVLSLPFGREIDDAAKRHELDVLLLASVVEAESSFRADAISPKGAMGLMQLMPLHFDDRERAFDPKLNLDLGARYLGSLRQRYDGDLELALAAYHAGPGTISRFGGAPPWRETRHYVDRVLALYHEHQANLAGESTAL